jgi:hypothetical protein
MRIEYLAAITIAAFAAVVLDWRSIPSARCHPKSSPRLPTLLAESVDPFLHRSGS